MGTADERKLLVVTPGQLGEGYLRRGPIVPDRFGAFIERREFKVVRRLGNGNYVVVDPESKSRA